MKRLTLVLPLALSSLLPICLGCPGPATEPPPAPPGNPPAMRQPAGMPEMPPDPRAVRGGPAGAPQTGAGNSAVGTTALPAKPVAGSALNKFFPPGATYTQEKAGFSMANLKGGGTLAITDLASNPSARDKYKSSTESIAGYPAVKQGSQGVGILVGDRYQVMVRGAADAQGALSSADLSGLAGLK